MAGPDSWRQTTMTMATTATAKPPPDGNPLHRRQVKPPLSPNRRRFALPAVCGELVRLPQQPEVCYQARVVRRQRSLRGNIPFAEHFRLYRLHCATRQHQV